MIRQIISPLISLGLVFLTTSCADTYWPISRPIMFGFASSLPPLPPLTSSELKVLRLMGGRVLPDGNITIGKVKLLRREHELAFPAETSITSGDLEVLICTEQGRAYESLLKTSVNPYNVQLALLLLGGVNGSRLKIPDQNSHPQGTLVDIFVRLPNGEKFPVEKWLRNKRSSKTKKRLGWVFVGSSFAGDKTCLATKEGNVVNTWSFGNTILDNQAKTGDTDDYFEAYTEKIPKSADKVTVIMKPRKPKPNSH